MIASQIPVAGSGKSANAWFALNKAYVSYDHPFDAPYEHALNIDFVNETIGAGARVAVELDAGSARSLAEAILRVLGEAEAGGHVTLALRADGDAAANPAAA
jgi:hypothetical protein